MRSKLSICRVVERSDRGSTPKGGGGPNMFLSSVKRKEQNEAEDSKMTEFLFLIVNSSFISPLSSFLSHLSSYPLPFLFFIMLLNFFDFCTLVRQKYYFLYHFARKICFIKEICIIFAVQTEKT